MTINSPTRHQNHPLMSLRYHFVDLYETDLSNTNYTIVRYYVAEPKHSDEQYGFSYHSKCSQPMLNLIRVFISIINVSLTFMRYKIQINILHTGVCNLGSIFSFNHIISWLIWDRQITIWFDMCFVHFILILFEINFNEFSVNYQRHAI